MHQVSLAASQSAKGALDGGLRRRSLRFTVSPSRSNSSPRTIEQSGRPFLLEPCKPFVPNTTAHTELPAHRRKRFLVLLHRQHKAHPFFHGTGLHPSHRQGPPCRPVDLLPMSPVYCVTYVAGQDLASTLSHKGRGEETLRDYPRPPLPLRPHRSATTTSAAAALHRTSR